MRLVGAVALPLAVLALGLVLLPLAEAPLAAAAVSAQRALQQSLGAALRAMREAGAAGAWPVVLAGFLYGVAHAAGPGHGKAVISAYALADAARLRRVAALAFAASMLQALTAILLVSAALFLFEATARQAERAAFWLERASFALIAAFGAAMALRAGLRLVRLLRSAGADAAADARRGPGGHGCAHAHASAAGCGHVHAPPPSAADGSWRRAAAAVLAVGLRPCSGAILALVFAKAIGMFHAGILAVLAMGLGTAATVAALAGLAVGFRRGALALVDGRGAALAGAALSAAGWTLMLLIGLLLLGAPAGPVGAPLR